MPVIMCYTVIMFNRAIIYILQHFYERLNCEHFSSEHPLQKRANLLTFQQNLFHPKINGEDPLRSEGPSNDEISRVGPLESAHVAAGPGPVIGRQPGPRQLAAL